MKLAEVWRCHRRLTSLNSISVRVSDIKDMQWVVLSANVATEAGWDGGHPRLRRSVLRCRLSHALQLPHNSCPDRLCRQLVWKARA